MAKQRKPNRWWIRLLLVVAVAVLVPYVFSRIMAPSRRIAVFPDSDVAMLWTAGKETIRVACYNIAHGRGVAESNWSGSTAKGRMDRLNAIGQLLKEIDADVVVLNEVDFDSSWSHSVNQAEFLAKVAGYPFRVEERNIDFRVLWWKWRFGNAVLSRFPIEQARVIELPDYATWETVLAGKKRAVQCEVAYNGAMINVIGAHLCHRSEDFRVDSVITILKNVGSSDVPTIIAGDMNSSPPKFPQHVATAGNRNAIEQFDLSQRFQRSPSDAPPSASSLTFPSTDPRIVIDWIFVPVIAEYEGYRVIRSLLSDHLPVVAEVEFQARVEGRLGQPQ